MIDTNSDKKNKNEDDDSIFLITTFHPSDHTVREIVYNNWDILGKNDETNFLFRKKLRIGYRRPKNIRDLLVHANIPRKLGDEAVDPMTQIRADEAARIASQQTPVLPAKQKVQKQITDFFTNVSNEHLNIVLNTEARGPIPGPIGVKRRMGTAPKHWGHNFCKNEVICRYCPKINKTGTITSNTTAKEFQCMKKISCRSSNLIYCITCNRCGMQYVGQTLLRLKDRFVGHFGDTEKNDMSKTVSRHFSSNGHNGVYDMTLSILEFIKKPPRSPAALTIRDRVERRWIHLLRTMAPLGMNIED